MNSNINHHRAQDTVITLSPNEKSDKRRDYLTWDEYFMAITMLELRKYDDTHTDAAIILNRRQIIVSMASSSSLNEDNLSSESNVNHAEYKALCKIQEGAVMYTTTFPCAKCAEGIVDSGIVELIYYQENTNSDIAREVLKQGGVTYRQFVNNRKLIEIDFSEFDDDSS